MCFGSGGPVDPLQTDDSAAAAEALTHVDGASPALGSTVSAAWAGRPGAAAYSPLIKGGRMVGSCNGYLPTPRLSPPHLFPFTMSL